MTGPETAAVRLNPRRIALGGILLVAAVFAYGYFFTEGLPWFWHDDVDRIQRVERTDWPELVRQTFDFASPNFGTERPVLQMFVKLSLALFGEYAHAHRMFKLAIFCGALAVLYLLLVRNRVRWGIAAGGLLLAATWPSVMIVTSWAYEAAAIELFFKVCALALFFFLMRREGSCSNPGTIAACALLLLLVILADHAKATAKILPAVFLATLVLCGSRRPHLYVVSLLALAAVFPYSVLLGHGAPPVSGGSFLPRLLANFGRQGGWVAAALLLGVAASRFRNLPGDPLLRLLFCWWVFEMAFCAVYPSGELRYLYSSLIAFTTFASAAISFLLETMRERSVRWVTVAACGLLSLAALGFNTRWNDSFRGSWGSFLVLTDKKMQYVNSHYRNSIFLYLDFNLLFYQRKTTNVYANINPVNSWGRKFYDVILPIGDSIHVRDGFEHVLLDGFVPYKYQDPIAMFYGVVDGSLWDWVHQRYELDLRRAHMHDLNLNDREDYPIIGGVSEVKGNRIDLVVH
ncbi:MAG TPA: hypothetical protein VIU29_00855 [Candidatus Deferrimicrobiaceae bacterium]